MYFQLNYRPIVGNNKKAQLTQR